MQNPNSGRLTEEEKMEVGSIPWRTYYMYVQCAGGLIVAFLVMITFIINVGSTGNKSLIAFRVPKLIHSL